MNLRQNFFRIVLDPSRPRIDLLVLPLSGAHNSPGAVKHEKPLELVVP